MLFRLDNQNLVRVFDEEEKIPRDFWIDLSNQIHEEPNLLSFSAETLEARYLRNETAVIVNEHKIISHLSFVGAFVDGVIQEGGRSLTEVKTSESISVHVLLTGWTAVNFRRMGLGIFLRKEVLKRKNNATSFLMGVSTNNASLPLWKKLGCFPIDYRTMPFVQVLSSLHPKMGGSDGNITKPTHSFWVSNPTLAYRLDEQLQEAIRLPVEEWKEQIKDKIFTTHAFLPTKK